MENFFSLLINVINELSIFDIVTLISLIILIIIILSIIYIYRVYTYDIEVEEIEDNDMLELQQIAEELEKTPKEVNIKLTPYEEEQEEKAIISYDELLKNTSAVKLNYQEEENISGVNIKQVDLNHITVPDDENTQDTHVKLFNYEKEEEFLQALNKLESMLS